MPGGVVRAIVFDFDGLMVDTETPVFEAWSAVFRDHGEELSQELWQGVIGHGPGYWDPVAELEARLGRTLDRDVVQAGRRRRELDIVFEQPALPGVREWIRAAVDLGLRLGVASSSGREWVSGHLERLGLDAFACVRCREDVARTKPAPDLYAAAVECLGVPAGEAVAIEDSQPGTESARAAGLLCIAVPGALTSAHHDFSAADLVLPSLAARSLVGALADLGRTPAG
jgi:HAD superfamily hydrolase (TIGR01509 family)